MIYTSKPGLREGDLVEIISPGKNYAVHPKTNLVKDHSELSERGKTFIILRLDYIENYNQWRALGNLDGEEYVSFAIDGIELIKRNDNFYEIF